MNFHNPNNDSKKSLWYFYVFFFNFDSLWKVFTETKFRNRHKKTLNVGNNDYTNMLM